MRRVQVIGIKSEGPKKAGWKEVEIPTDAENFSWEPVSFQKTHVVREGSEKPIAAPKGAICNLRETSFSHKVKEGSDLYDLGPKPKAEGHVYACSKHFFYLMTLESLISRYQNDKHFLKGDILDYETRTVLFHK